MPLTPALTRRGPTFPGAAVSTRVRAEYERIGLALALLAPVLIPIGFWLAFMTTRPCNIDFCSGTVLTAAGATLLWAGIVSLGVGAGLLRAAAKTP